jgi:hypothetical protein
MAYQTDTSRSSFKAPSLQSAAYAPAWIDTGYTTHEGGVLHVREACAYPSDPRRGLQVTQSYICTQQVQYIERH